MTVVTDMMDQFTLSDIVSPEEIQIIMYQLDLATGAGGLDEEGNEFTQHTQSLVS